MSFSWTLPTHTDLSLTNSSTLDFFNIPDCIKDLVAKYFTDLQMCCSTLAAA